MDIEDKCVLVLVNVYRVGTAMLVNMDWVANAKEYLEERWCANDDRRGVLVHEVKFHGELGEFEWARIRISVSASVGRDATMKEKQELFAAEEDMPPSKFTVCTMTMDTAGLGNPEVLEGRGRHPEVILGDVREMDYEHPVIRSGGHDMPARDRHGVPFCVKAGDVGRIERELEVVSGCRYRTFVCVVYNVKGEDMVCLSISSCFDEEWKGVFHEVTRVVSPRRMWEGMMIGAFQKIADLNLRVVDSGVPVLRSKDAARLTTFVYE